MPEIPPWARWNPCAAQQPWSVGLEEEVMLLDPEGWTLAPRVDDVLLALGPELGSHASAETHSSALELATSPHNAVQDAVAELGDLRDALGARLETLGLAAAVAGTHPTAQWTETAISSGARYQSIHASMRELARREPTFALHVHVGVPTPELATRALTRLRAHLPVLLALSASSPFWQGRDSGLASARTPLFDAFPRSGLPRAFHDYADYVEAVDLLLRCDAFPEPTFLWWDARLQPRFGTLEVRVMDAQPNLRDVAALAAMVQCLVRLEATEGHAAQGVAPPSEVLDENRFLAARDGVDSRLIDPVQERRRPLAELAGELLGACGPHAAALGCEAQLAGIDDLLHTPTAAMQRSAATGPDGLSGLVASLAEAFSAQRPRARA